MYKNILLPSGIAGIYLNLCQLYFLPLSSPDVEIHPGRSSQSPADKGQHWRLQVCRPQVSHFKSHKCFSELVWNYTTQFYAPHDTQLALRWALLLRLLLLLLSFHWPPSQLSEIPLFISSSSRESPTSKISIQFWENSQISGKWFQMIDEAKNKLVYITLFWPSQKDISSLVWSCCG